jgi:glycosyltransferase involved in cell wall biosynthesis
MATRTPVVVTRKGGIPLAVKDGYNGLFVRPRNPREIAQQVNLLLNNPALSKKIGENARKTIREKFMWSKIGLRFERMYKEFALKTSIH